MRQPVEAVLIGAGDRGANAYGPYVLDHPDELRFVAVAEPQQDRREHFAREHTIAPDRRFHRWQELLGEEQMAEAVLVCTPDRLHVEPALWAMAAGYHVLLEKPMAPTPEDCVRLIEGAREYGRVLKVAHVLRYTDFFKKVHSIVESGHLGDIITVQHQENVASFHMAHSYVRGQWRHGELASPMILAKCCHDMDLLHWNLGRCARVASFGSLTHFTEKRAAPGIPHRCTDGCPIEKECPFSAIGIYLEFRPFPELAAKQATTGKGEGGDGANIAPACWPFNVVTPDRSYEGRLEALRSGPYGRCVYRCDNDVVDHQVVAMEFESGATVSFVMHGHSHEEHRSLRYDGSRATLRGRFGTTPAKSDITIHDHLSGREERVLLGATARSWSGHGGGDYGVMAAFVRAVRGQESSPTSARASLESHLMAFAAEEARTSGETVELAALRSRILPTEEQRSQGRGR